MRYVRWVKAILIIFLALFISGSIWADEREEKHPIDVWLEKCMEKNFSVDWKVDCVIQAINIETKSCMGEDTSTYKRTNCLAKSLRFWDRVVDNKNIQKLVFDENAYKKKQNKKYINYIWKHWIVKEALPEYFERISKNDILLIKTDLNDDGNVDLIATVSYPYFCGRAGAECPFKIFIAKPRGGFSVIESCMNIAIHMPIYIINSKINGLKKLVINGVFVAEYDGKKNLLIKEVKH